jgi:hypothetical protein
MINKIVVGTVFAFLYNISAQAIVIRHDVDDKKYLATTKDFPPLATLYSICVHGTLIAPSWFVTAGHAVFCMEPGDKIKVGNQWAEIESRFAHADYELGEDNDIALLKLKHAITDIKPAKLYRESEESQQNIWFIGVGGSGNGNTGQTISYSQNKGTLRKAENKIEEVREREIFFVVDKEEDALPLEGVSGNADSGGPAYKLINDDYYLFGISSRNDSFFKDVGEYGVDEVYSRVSYHANWIDKVIANDVEFIAKQTTQHHFAQENIEDNLAKACAMIGFK